jgi:hypothetical protein
MPKGRDECVSQAASKAWRMVGESSQQYLQSNFDTPASEIVVLNSP